MGIFSLFKKKEAVQSPILNGAAWQESSFQAAEAFREPLSPLTGLMPPPSLETSYFYIVTINFKITFGL